MTIIGIDPGTARVGWAVVTVESTQIGFLSYGCITTPTNESPEERLDMIHRHIAALLVKHKPQSVALEDLFFATNAKTAIPVAQARGVILLASAQHHVPVVSYSPPAVKLAITGDGRADKSQVTRMVVKLLGLAKPPKPDDTADALAIALTHAYSYKLKRKYL